MTSHTKETSVTSDQSLLARYLRAESMEHEICNQSMVLNTQITPHWIGDSNSFWYARRIHKEGGSTADISTEYCLHVKKIYQCSRGRSFIK